MGIEEGRKSRGPLGRARLLYICFGGGGVVRKGRDEDIQKDIG